MLTQDDITHSVKAYYGSVDQADHLVGLVLDLLEQNGLVDDTMVVYTSDHGEMLAHNGLYFKDCLYEPAVRVPCIIRYPGVIPAGQVVSQCTEQIDLLPTMFDFAGIPPQGTEQGVSMRNLIMNPDDPTWKDEAFSEDQADLIMIRTGQWKYNYHPDDRDQLFDLASDPDEVVNLVDDPQYADIKAYLQGRIADKFGVVIVP
jgi:arylsulfatase A-like enzyme